MNIDVNSCWECIFNNTEFNNYYFFFGGGGGDGNVSGLILALV